MSIHRLTAELVERDPDIWAALQRGIVNYSALARHLLATGIFPEGTSHGSVVVALQRMAGERRQIADYPGILRRSELEIKTRMAVIIVQSMQLSAVERRIRDGGGYFQAIQGRDVHTIITNEKHAPDVVEHCGDGVVEHRSRLVLFVLVSPRDIESTPGVVSYLYSLLAVHGVNVIETMSCWTDTLFVVHKDDLSLVTDLLG